MPLRALLHKDSECGLLKSNSLRQSNFELLRLICMFLIVMHHFGMHACDRINVNYLAISFNKVLVQLFTYGGKFGVDVFIIMTGFFLVSKSFKISKIVRLYALSSFYSVCILLLGFAMGWSVSNKFILTSIFPVEFVSYWFISDYLLLYLLFPIINVLLKRIDFYSYVYALGIGGYVVCIFPMFTFSHSSGLLLFTYLYSIGAFIRLYGERIPAFFKSIWFPMITFVAIFVLLLMFDFLGDNLGSRFLLHNSTFTSVADNPLMVCMSAGVFMVFSRIKIKSGLINSLAVSVFAVYLIHENQLLKKVIWGDLFSPMRHFDSWLFLIYSVLCILLVFLSCLMIDRLRILLLKLLRVDKIADRFLFYLDQRFNTMLDNIKIL